MPFRTIFSVPLSYLLSLLSLFLTPHNPKPSHHRRFLRGPHHHHSPPPSTAATTSIPPSLPPAQPPSPSLPKYPSSSLPTPTIPTTSNPASTFPFFPSLPSPPPPPSTPASISSVATFPANISSVLPTAPHSASSSLNLLPTILLPLLSVSLLALSLSLLLLHLRRRRRRSSSGKDARSDSIRLFPPPPPSTSNPSTEFLYLGTLVSPRGTSQPLDPTTSADAGGGGVASGGGASPELRPLPPLPRNISCSHGMVDNVDGSAPSSLSDPDSASTSVSSSLPTSSSHTRFSRSSKESESSSGGAGGDAELRMPPIPPPPATMLWRLNPNQNSNPNPYVQRNERPRLKPLFWDKLPSSSSRVMAWDHLKSGSFQLNEEMIQSLFGCKTAANGTGKQFNVRDGVCSTGGGNVFIIDQKKLQNIAILLKALNVSKEQVCEALLDGDAAKIGIEMLEALRKMSLTKEEESKLKEHKDDSPFKLGSAETFLKAVTSIPFAFRRVDAMLFVANFDQEVTYLKGCFGILEGACDELRNSRLFHKLLDAVLKVGNRINLGTHRGDAKAFKLDTLLKLTNIRSNDGKTTLLHFIIQEVIKSEKLAPQFITLLESELNNVKKASKIDPDELTCTVSKLSNGIEKVRDVIQLNQPLLENEGGRSFHETMSVFLQRAEEEILEIQNQENVTLSSIKDVADFFHGDSAKEESEPFRIFAVVRDFLAQLDSKICKEAGKMNECVAPNYGCQIPVLDRIRPLV